MSIEGGVYMLKTLSMKGDNLFEWRVSDPMQFTQMYRLKNNVWHYDPVLLKLHFGFKEVFHSKPRALQEAHAMLGEYEENEYTWGVTEVDHWRHWTFEELLEGKGNPKEDDESKTETANKT